MRYPISFPRLHVLLPLPRLQKRYAPRGCQDSQQAAGAKTIQLSDRAVLGTPLTNTRPTPQSSNKHAQAPTRRALRLEIALAYPHTAVFVFTAIGSALDEGRPCACQERRQTMLLWTAFNLGTPHDTNRQTTHQSFDFGTIQPRRRISD